MSFSAKILKHSINPFGQEAFTFLATYERFIHADVMTHRWSRNASSSRAIPYETMVRWILREPAMQLHVGKNQSGMQAGQEIAGADEFQMQIRAMLLDTVDRCNILFDTYKPHKEVINRYTEPWGWITTIMTMGKAQLNNYFRLRCSPMAGPNNQRLAVNMARMARSSVPQRLNSDQWHMPFFDDYIPCGNIDDENVRKALVWSVARSAWCSYNSPEKDATFERALARHDSCIEDKHCTPLEHQLRTRHDKGKLGLVPGYDSYRMMVPDESSEEWDYSLLDTVYKDRDFVIA